MKLYLMQHGQAMAKEQDPERPLTQQGRQDVDRLGQFLRQAGVRVVRVIHSGKLRARQSAETLAEVVTPGLEPEVSGLLGPNDNPKAFDWQSESWDRDTLVVGHLPFMARLAAHLVAEDEKLPLVAFQPGSLVCLERNDGHWQIAWMLRPELFG
ncbi:MAG: phosphohistidine phosphatase SixA [Chromatiales bacterium]|jgi:phosphohistidine phosphatase